MVNGKIAFTSMFVKEFLIRFVMTSRFIDFALVILYLLMFKVCGVIGISMIEFFNFSGTERVKQNKKNFKNQSKPSKLLSLTLFKQFQQKAHIFLAFCWKLSFPLTYWAGDGTDLPSNSNISKTVAVNIVFAKHCVYRKLF